ncbi:hypothetical protein LguiA_034581 [Lonicera macranthoides]
MLNGPEEDGFDFKSQFLTDSRSLISETHPELLDLVDNGSLVLIKKSQFGPVPFWRTEFVEPEVIWLIGTTHISLESAVDVERVVRAVKPDNVVVELCRSRQRTGLSSIHGLTSLVAEFIFRAGIMYTSNDGELGQQLKSNMFSLTGNGFFGAVGRSINLGGQTALALRLLLAAFSSKLSSDVNRPFGDEFRAARKASEEVGAQIVLGDRPIEITLERAWRSLKWSEKLNLLVAVGRGITSSSDLPTEKLKIWVLGMGYSTRGGVGKRSWNCILACYIAWSLKRSKAVNHSKRVVGVIGKGHMNGVIYALVSDLGDLRFRDLCGERSSSGSGGWVEDLIKNLVRDTVIGLILWALFEQFKNG